EGGVELVRLIEEADAGVRQILGAGERATELRVGERGAGGETLHVARARVRVGDQRLPVVGVLLPELEGHVVRVVLALVPEIDRGGEAGGSPVRDDTRRRDERDRSGRRITEVGVDDAARVADAGRLADV